MLCSVLAAWTHRILEDLARRFLADPAPGVMGSFVFGDAFGDASSDLFRMVVDRGAAIHAHSAGQHIDKIPNEPFDTTAWKINTKDWDKDIAKFDGRPEHYRDWSERMVVRGVQR